MPTTPKSPLTRAEATTFAETSRHADVMAFLHALGERRDPRLQLSSFGRSPEGRELPLAIASARSVRTPDEARASGLPVVLVLCGIHAGEVEGKEGGLMLLRDLLDGQDEGLLDKMILLLAPLFNPDGNDRIDPANRKLDLAKLEGQDGPASGVGTRTTAAGINLNRDYLRQDAPEMRLLAHNVWLAWDPHLTIDCHATNGSVHRYALTYDTPHTTASGPGEPIRWMRETLLPAVRAGLRARTGLETFFYGNFVADEGGRGEGWITYTHHPRFGSNYRGLTGRLDLLAETYSYLSFPERVRASYEFVREALLRFAEHGEEAMQVVQSSQVPPERIAVRYRLEATAEPVEILTREPRRPDGSPVSVRIPHLARFVGTEVVDRPWGYVVPEALARRLEGHGIQIERLGRERAVAVEVATVLGAGNEASRRILEASADGERELAVEIRRETRRHPQGTLYLRADQPRAAIAVYLCEARSDDGAIGAGMVPEPAAGAELPMWRLLEPLA